jgi:hypothetical protein
MNIIFKEEALSELYEQAKPKTRNTSRYARINVW